MDRGRMIEGGPGGRQERMYRYRIPPSSVRRYQRATNGGNTGRENRECDTHDHGLALQNCSDRDGRNATEEVQGGEMGGNEPHLKN